MAIEPIRLTQLSHGGGCGCKIAPGVLEKILAQHAGGLVPPQFVEPAGEFAPIEGQRICQQLGFVYRWPDPAHWFADGAALKG